MPAAPLILLLKSLDQPSRAQPDAGNDKKRSTRDDPRLLKAAGGGMFLPLLKGGPGSGNFGHLGRPGLRGGSAGPDIQETHIAEAAIAGTEERELRLAAREYARAKFGVGHPGAKEHRAFSVQNNALGRRISVSFAGVKHATRSSSVHPDHFRAVAGLPLILKHAALLSTASDKKGRATIKAVHFMAAPVRIGVRRYAIRLVIRETDQRHLYYDHALAGLHPLDASAPEARPSKEAADGSEPTAWEGS